MLDRSKIPRHVAIIMDGNGRWAKRHALIRSEGHRRGMDVVRNIVRAARELGIEYLTLYAFSSENWKRPKEEVDFLMAACEAFIERELPALMQDGIRFRHIGWLDGLPETLKACLARACAATKDNEGLTILLAFNYGARREILDAVRRITQEALQGRIRPDEINDDMFAARLLTHGVPDPDLLIRTSGELRVSNFLLWQIAYAEFHVTKKCWPEFNKRDLVRAIEDYQRRRRRFGGIDG